MYYFSIPDSGIVRVLNCVLFHTLSQNSEWFYDDFKIDIIYGCPPRCIWNGGRIVDSERELGKEELQYLFSVYKQLGTTYRLNFTNQCLVENDLNDKYCNMIAKLANENRIKATVTMPMMAEYLQKNYPNLQISWSTSTIFGDNLKDILDKINELSKDNLVVLPYNFNNCSEIKKFKYPNNLEVLVCDCCMDNCPQRRFHQKIVSQAIRRHDDNMMYNDCIMRKRNGEEFFNLDMDIDNRELVTEVTYKNTICRSLLPAYDKIGINKFKISGRSNLSMAMAAYIHFFVLPQYYETVVCEWEQEMRQIYISQGILSSEAYPSLFNVGDDYCSVWELLNNSEQMWQEQVF